MSARRAFGALAVVGFVSWLALGSWAFDGAAFLTVAGVVFGLASPVVEE